MEKILNHLEQQHNYIIPYLREFDGTYQLNKVNGERWQSIEDILWTMLQQLDIDIASGIWLDFLGEKAGRPREIFTLPANLFEFDTDTPDINGFVDNVGDTNGGILLEGTGSGGYEAVSLEDEIYRLFIKFSMIRNNFDSKRQSIIDAIKILTNASKVLLRTISKLKLDITIQATIADEYALAIKELIREIVPQCIELDNIYIMDTINSFQLDSEQFGLDSGLIDVPL